MKPLYLIIVIFLSPLLLIAQVNRTKNHRCGTIEKLKLHFKQNPELKKRFELERMRFNQVVKDAVARKANRTGNFRTAATTIPVVFHIVTTNPNSVTDAQIQAQLDTLNKDFAGTNGDAVNVPSYFKSLFGSSGIQFCLAKRTPDGNPTNGIERITTNETSFDAYEERMKHASTGGADAWDPSRYYNIWLINISPDGSGKAVLGYATLPGDENGPPSEQGVVIDYNSLPGGSTGEYNSGKTLVHETGHYFNLYHIWGDQDEAEDDDHPCAGSDEVEDTPNQAGATEGCFSGIKTDQCTTGGNGIMYQNYMDYSFDRCLIMFTKDQVTRMENALVQYRMSLMSSDGCTPVFTTNYNAKVVAINAPLQQICTGVFSASVVIGNTGSETLTALTVSAKIDAGPVRSINWTGTLTPSSNTTVQFNNLTTDYGRHLLTIYVSNPNNRDDEYKQNDTLYTSIQYSTPVTNVTESFEANTFPPANWNVANPNNNITWKRKKGIAKTGNASVYIDNYVNERIGDRDDLILPTINLSNVDSAFLSFEVAYSTYSNSGTPQNAWDTLEVLASTDCGGTYKSIYKKWGGNLATRITPTQEAFEPNPNEWRKDSISLVSYVGQPNLTLIIRNTNGFENNLYLDDINVKVNRNPNLTRLGFMVTPNPSNGVIVAQFYPIPTNLLGIDIFNAMGQKLSEISVKKGQASNYYSFDISQHAAGTYYIRAIFSDRIVTRKIFKY